MTLRAEPIGRPGVPWGEAERAEWRARQRVQRRYDADVLARVDALGDRYDLVEYGRIDAGSDGSYPLRAIASRGRDEARPLALVTGGVHGYETSGVHGALAFVERHGGDYSGRIDLLVAPCVSPWAYERIHRWNPHAVDPNRSFRADGAAEEARALMRLVAPLRARFLVHVDLHETTDSDESEFRPALAARDGKPFEPEGIPDGFYLCADAANPQHAFQRAILDAVARITHIAPADADGNIIGSPVVVPGVIEYDYTALGLCGGVTGARYTTTTEVYPDSPRATPAQCIDAQVAAVRAALAFAIAHR